MDRETEGSAGREVWDSRSKGTEQQNICLIFDGEMVNIHVQSYAAPDCSLFCEQPCVKPQSLNCLAFAFPLAPHRFQLISAGSWSNWQSSAQ